MSSASKAYSQMLSQLQSYLMGQVGTVNAAARQESPYYTSLAKDASGYENYLKGNRMQPPPGYQMNMTPVATSYRAAQLQNNPLGGGTAARGIQPAGAYQLSQADMTDQLAHNFNAARQANVNQGANQAVNTEFGLGQAEQNRNTSVANNMQSLLGTYIKGYTERQPGFWSRLAQSAVANAGGIIGAAGGLRNG